MWNPLVPLTLIVVLQFSTTAVIVGFANQRSLFRAAFLGPMIIATCYHFSTLERIQNSISKGFFGAASIFSVFLYLDAALLSRWTFQGPTSPLGGLRRVNSQGKPPNTQTSSFSSRLRFGYWVSLQSRFPGTEWAVKNIPSFSKSNPAYVPSRSAFLLRNTLKCLIFGFILRATNDLGNPQDNPTLFSSARIPLLTRLGDVTMSEFETRILGVLGYWVVEYLFIDVLYSILACVTVALHITDVEAWPPVFGSVLDACSIRQFWGHFYHLLIRQGCNSIAYYIVYSCLHLRKNSLITKYAIITMVFTVSGLFHFLCDISQAIPWYESGAMRFFCNQAIGIMFEDVFQTITEKLGIKTKSFSVVKRVFGYVWLVAWLVWTSPIFVYPIMGRDVGTPIVSL